MDTPGKRIIKWREHLKLKPREFAEATGIPYTTLKTIESDSNKPSYDVLSKLRNAFPELNIDWIFDDGDTEPMMREDRSLRRTEKASQPEQTLVAESNTDEYYHRYHALLDMVKTGFFGSPEQLLRKKANASSGAASLFETVDAIAAEYPLYEEMGFKQAGRQLRLA
jgi:transcriptional regulator with XRE-family HTH domain